MTRGLAYKCKTCGKIFEKKRCKAHILVQHVSMEEAPILCGLCSYRAMDEADYEKHLGFSRHKGVQGNKPVENWRRISSHPVRFELHMEALTKEESAIHWKKASAPATSAPLPEVQQVQPPTTQVPTDQTATAQPVVDLSGVDLGSLIQTLIMQQRQEVYSLANPTVQTNPAPLLTDGLQIQYVPQPTDGLQVQYIHPSVQIVDQVPPQDSLAPPSTQIDDQVLQDSLVQASLEAETLPEDPIPDEIQERYVVPRQETEDQSKEAAEEPKVVDDHDESAASKSPKVDDAKEVAEEPKVVDEHDKNKESEPVTSNSPPLLDTPHESLDYNFTPHYSPTPRSDDHLMLATGIVKEAVTACVATLSRRLPPPSDNLEALTAVVDQIGSLNTNLLNLVEVVKPGIKRKEEVRNERLLPTLKMINNNMGDCRAELANIRTSNDKANNHLIHAADRVAEAAEKMATALDRFSRVQETQINTQTGMMSVFARQLGLQTEAIGATSEAVNTLSVNVANADENCPLIQGIINGIEMKEPIKKDHRKLDSLKRKALATKAGNSKKPRL